MSLVDTDDSFVTPKEAFALAQAVGKFDPKSMYGLYTETSAEPSLQAKQLLLKRARLADDLNDKISQRPGPMELIHKNILPVHSSLKQAIIGTEVILLNQKCQKVFGPEVQKKTLRKL